MEIFKLCFIPSAKRLAISFDESDSDQENEPSKRKMRKFLQNEDEQIIECIAKPSRDIEQTQMFHIFGDLCFNSQQQIKLGTIVTWSEIGFEYLSTQKIVAYDKFIDLQMSFTPLPRIGLENFADKLLSIPSSTHQEFYKVFIIYKCYIRYMKKQYLLKNQLLEDGESNKQEIQEISLNQKRKRSQIDNYNKSLILDYFSSYKLSKIKVLQDEFIETCNYSHSSNQPSVQDEKCDQLFSSNFKITPQRKESPYCINIDSPIVESSLDFNHTEENTSNSDLKFDNCKKELTLTEINSLEENFSSIIDEIESTQDESIQQKMFEIEEEDNKNEEYYEFSEFCFKLLKEKIVPKYNLYSFAIGRVDFLTNQIQSSHMGYSKDFLQLICMDTNILENLFLRGKSYDLIQDNQMALEESLNHLLHRTSEEKVFESRIKLKTLDGFDLWVNQRCSKLIHLPENKGTRFNFYFAVGEIDIELPQLEALIHYRQAQSSGNFNYDEFIQKELSYLLEDVEYSVQSQEFLEKYYNDKLMTLAKLKEEQISKKIEPLPLCGFKKLITSNYISQKC